MLRFERDLSSPDATRVWDSGHPEHLEVAGDAVAWIPRAVRVRFVDKHGRLDYAWV